MGIGTIKNAVGLLKFYSSASARNPGDIVVHGERVILVVGSQAIAIGDDWSATASGQVELDAKSADTWSDGDLVYWDATEEELTSTAGANKSAGLAVGAKTSGMTRADVDLNASVASDTI